MKIAVTGATGYLGHLVVNGLLERLPSQDVIAVVRDGEKAAGLAQQGAVVRVAAYGDPDALKKSLPALKRFCSFLPVKLGSDSRSIEM
jgi:NAD(P)H dehydrogenase (quinone)